MSKAKQSKSYTMTEKVGRYPSETAAWYLLEIPKKIGEEIYANFKDVHRGFGSLPVLATIGETTWRTSIFRSKHASTYMLFLKAAVRKKEGIEAGDKIIFNIKLANMQRETIQELEGKIIKQNIHPLTDFGKPRGREIW